MNIHVLSDAHVEFQHWRREPQISLIACDVHVLAGGIGIGMSRTVANSHVYLLGNERIGIQGVRLLGTSLWEDLSLFGQDQREQMAFNGTEY